MATIRFSSAFNMLQAQDWDWEVTQNTATSLVIQDVGAGKKQTFTGTFAYDVLGNVSGNATGTAFFENSVLVYRVSGMNHDAATLQTFAETSGDTQETYAFVLSGNDMVTGSDGADTLLGYGGDDRVDGGGGADVMLGMTGDDTYTVDSAMDKVFETTTRASGLDAGGTDVVLASVSFKLSTFVEKLTLTGTSNIDGTGNGLANVIKGSDGSNALAGGAGADTIIGGNGHDVLIGGAGKDILTGGAGQDIYVYNSVAESGPTAAAWDVVKDFASGQDLIDLSAIDANGAVAGDPAFMFSGLGTEASWGSDGTGKLRYEIIGGRVVIFGSTDADLDAEFAIFVVGVDAISSGDLVK